MTEVVTSSSPTETTAKKDNRPALIVGIGASAGGLEALEAFFDHVPLDSGMAFVVVQHLSPDFKSLMDEILSRRTKLPVHLVEDGVQVERDRVYLIPAKKEMIISQGRLLLSDRGHDQELSLPIDVFFRSLAQDCGTRAVAVVLSGGGSDGSRGVCDVHDVGGLVLVQDPESAQFDGMPRTARDAGVADALLAPQEMPQFLRSHLAGASARSTEVARSDELGMSAVYRMLEKEFGIDFTHYKPSTVTRRIERRLQLSRADNVDAYVKRLREERAELDVLYRDLLIGVTRFFRNEEAFQLMEERVLPELWQSLPKDAPLRVWVAGCATGEEVYSLAILLFELGQRLGERPVKIFATDVHRGSLDIATRGLYDEQAVAGVSEARLQQHFLRRGQSYQVSPELRQMVVFAAHNVIKDAPFTRVNLISCRNMLIYLQPAAQQRALSLFHFALSRGGVLFLGPSESPGALTHDFATIDKHWRIYEKTSDSRVQVDTRPQIGARGLRGTPAPPPAPRLSPSPNRYSVPQLLGVYDRLLSEVIPPSLLVNDLGELVHVFGGAARFLHLQDGRPGLDVLDLVDGELKTALAGSLKRALKLNTPITLRSVHVQDGAASGRYKITIRPLRGPSNTPSHHLISFDLNELDAPAKPAETELDLAEVSREQLAALETELKYTKENLQSATEELESSNEELQAANEELLASNEELQSTNEELQSVNEELYSVNAEYQRKISDLTELANDMENLLASTDIGTVFLDAQLRIRNFTSRAAEVFHLLPHDIGRPIENLTHSMEYPELAMDFRQVLGSGTPVEKELRDGAQRTFFARILPYRAKGTIDGVVLTLIDVSSLKVAEDALFHERYLLNSLLASVPDAIYFKDARGRFIRANHALAVRLGIDDPRKAVGKTGFELPSYDNALAVHQQDDLVLRTGVAQHYQLERRQAPDGRAAWDLVTRLPLSDTNGGVVGIIGIFRDVTEQKRNQEKIQEAVQRRDQFLAMLSHELRNPLGAIVTASQLLQTGEPSAERRQRLLDVLSRQSEQMSRLLDDLLEASRVTQDKIELRKRTLDIRSIVRESAEAVRELMQTRQLTLEVELDEQPLHVDCDPARLQQIHANLLNNAAKYTPIGGHVWLSVTREGDEAVLRVRDDGVGIPPDTLADVFELFVQSTRTLDRAEGGLGVGLTLVRGLVERHGGRVEALSAGIGQGTEIVVHLPLSTSAPEQLSAPPPSQEQNSRNMTRTPLRVVIVEDNDDSRLMLSELFELSGFECATAATGPLGVELIRESRPDVALVDIGLPELDGLEVARLVRQDPALKQLLLIALTGYGQREDREAARQAGFDTHFVKPVDFDALISLLRAHAAKRTTPGSNASDTGT